RTTTTTAYRLPLPDALPIYRIGQRLPRLGVLHPPALARSAAAGRVIHIHPTRLQLPQLAATAGHGSHQLRRGQGGTPVPPGPHPDRKSTRLNSSHVKISYAV